MTLAAAAAAGPTRAARATTDPPTTTPTGPGRSGTPTTSAEMASSTSSSRRTSRRAARSTSERSDGGSPMDVFPEQSASRRWPRTLAVLATVLVLLAGAYVGAMWLWSDRVPSGATVAGVEVGGLRASEAVSRVEESLAAATTEPIPVAAGEKRTTLDPAAAGLTLDAVSTIDQVTGFGLAPARFWEQLFGIGAIEPVAEIDENALAAAVEQVGEALVTEPVDGSVLFVDGQAQATAAVEGAAVDAGAAAAVITDGWLTAARPLELPTEVTAPAITQAEVDRVLVEVARPLAGAAVTVSVAGQLAELPVDVVTGAASFVPEGDSLVLEMDGAVLVEAVMARTTNLLSTASDATFAFQDGVPVIVPGTPGTTLDPVALAEAVGTAGVGSDRTAVVELLETDPAESTAELEALAITQIVSEFSTPLTSEPRRTGNIINGASKINGTLVRPGETFSLTEALGPVDGANGFVEAGAIINGEHVDAFGGGLSQLSTTTYNASFLAGYEDIEHHPHSEWFARYPEGREATIFTGSLDMQWKNNTPYGALVQAFVEGGRVHVKIWGTPYWTVEHSTSGRSGIVQPTTVYSQSATCEPQSAGNPGFTVTVNRRVLLDGVEADAQSWTVRYKPQNQVICGVPPAPPTTP